MRHADYRKHNDGSHNSSTYHKKDGTPVRQILAKDTRKRVEAYLSDVDVVLECACIAGHSEPVANSIFESLRVAYNISEDDISSYKVDV